MKKILTAASVLSLSVVAGCATYGGYQPVVDNTPSYQRHQSRQRYETPPQQLYQQVPVLDKRGRHMRDPATGQPLYKSVPVTDQYGNPVYHQQPQSDYRDEGPANSVTRDSVECQQLDRQAANTAGEAVKGGLMGGLLGAAGGAAIGAITGDPGRGAALGAAAGGIGGAGYSGLEADERYKRAYINCMRNRGHNVVN